MYDLYQGAWVVDPGAKWRARAVVSSSGGISTGGGSFPGDICVRVVTWVNGDDGTITVHESAKLRGAKIPATDNSSGAVFQNLDLEVTIPEGHNRAVFRVFAQDVTDGQFDVYSATFTRIENNYTALDMVYQEPLEPSRRYSGFLRVRSGPNLVQGSLILEALYSSSGPRVDVRAELGTVDDTHNEEQLLNFSLQLPSGYDYVQLRIKGKDILGDSFTVTGGYWADSDDSSRSVTAASPATQSSYGDIANFSWVSPAGTERIHGQVVADDLAAGWVVDNVNIHRVNAPISTTANVIDFLCRDPETGAYLVTPGTIEDTAVPYDLRYRNMTCRSVLKPFSRSVMQPAREWRVSAENVLDWGLPEALFTDRTGFILRPSDVELLEAPALEESAETSVQKVKVLGAGRQAVGGRKQILEATATNSAAGKVNYFGDAWNRKRIVSDATIDHIDYAKSLARFEADKDATPRQSTRLRLADWTALAKFNLGDWIYVYKPEAGLVDYSNERNIDGEVVWPKRVRVISRVWKLGSGFRAELRTSDGTLIPLENVGWESETAAEIEVGEFRPEFVADPQGGASGNQFLRYLASSPR